ncbi:MAG: asparaginase domain-containing protein [Rhodothermales bacterium]|nr:asparaginase domain-containing protein [Rhodothermales bacterium]
MQIKIFTTGGTIDKVYFDAKSEFAVGDPQITRILSDAGVVVSYAIERLLSKDSLEITDADRALMLERVSHESAPHILITHGTDTMVDTARVLEAVPNKTIVLVGSLSPARFKNSDAEFNIGFALATVQAMPPGVYIAMNGRIFSSGSVRKNREKNCFESTAP